MPTQAAITVRCAHCERKFLATQQTQGLTLGEPKPKPKGSTASTTCPHRGAKLTQSAG